MPLLPSVKDVAWEILNSGLRKLKEGKFSQVAYFVNEVNCFFIFNKNEFKTMSIDIDTYINMTQYGEKISIHQFDYFKKKLINKIVNKNFYKQELGSLIQPQLGKVLPLKCELNEIRKYRRKIGEIFSDYIDSNEYNDLIGSHEIMLVADKICKKSYEEVMGFFSSEEGKTKIRDRRFNQIKGPLNDLIDSACDYGIELDEMIEFVRLSYIKNVQET